MCILLSPFSSPTHLVKKRKLDYIKTRTKKKAECQGKATIQNSTIVPPYRDMFNLTCSIECCIITRFSMAL